MALRPDGQQLITSSGAAWSLAQIGKLAQFEKELEKSAIAAISGDERLLAVTDSSTNAIIRDAKTLAIKAKLTMTAGGDKTMLRSEEHTSELQSLMHTSY